MSSLTRERSELQRQPAHINASIARPLKPEALTTLRQTWSRDSNRSIRYWYRSTAFLCRTPPLLPHRLRHLPRTHRVLPLNLRAPALIAVAAQCPQILHRVVTPLRGRHDVIHMQLARRPRRRACPTRDTPQIIAPKHPPPSPLRHLRPRAVRQRSRDQLRPRQLPAPIRRNARAAPPHRPPPLLKRIRAVPRKMPHIHLLRRSAHLPPHPLHLRNQILHPQPPRPAPMYPHALQRTLPRSHPPDDRAARNRSAAPRVIRLHTHARAPSLRPLRAPARAHMPCKPAQRRLNPLIRNPRPTRRTQLIPKPHTSPPLSAAAKPQQARSTQSDSPQRTISSHRSVHHDSPKTSHLYGFCYNSIFILTIARASTYIAPTARVPACFPPRSGWHRRHACALGKGTTRQQQSHRAMNTQHHGLRIAPAHPSSITPTSTTPSRTAAKAARPWRSTSQLWVPTIHTFKP